MEGNGNMDNYTGQIAMILAIALATLVMVAGIAEYVSTTVSDVAIFGG